MQSNKEKTELTKADNRIEFSPDQVNLIKSLIAKDCNNDELNLFLYQCKRTGLDPLTRQIYCIKRAGRMTIQTSIDGFRVIAERSGSYAGQDEPIWEDENGVPVKCTVKVYRFSSDGQRYAAGVGTAYFKEYYPNPMNLQKTMPHMMIAKVAEALALRKAYPQDLSGLYTGDEMEQDAPQERQEIKQDIKPILPYGPVKQPENKPQVENINLVDVLNEKITQVNEATSRKGLKEWAQSQPERIKEQQAFKDAVNVKYASLPEPVSKGEDTRPWLSDADYKESIVMINNGEDTLYESLNQKYRMKKVYREGLVQATEFAKKVAR